MRGLTDHTDRLHLLLHEGEEGARAGLAGLGDHHGLGLPAR